MLDTLTRDLRAGTRTALLRAARRAYLLALGALAVPAVLIGTVLLLSPAQPDRAAAVILWAVAVALGLGAFVLARRAAHRADLSAPQAALTGAIQASSAPGVPLLLACAFAGTPLLGLSLLITGALLHLLVWRQLPGWVREP
ncbi:hypothetical protein [Deinococcus radiotolerans]|uniref:Integral membrane protein n=1 Tax=Deinococcus radiotolerans TaxID=1309407 RepID=A0ABQ2FN57_9DEIO|nr:hypothetical protein [Deinococcus radiotolerans]GGL10486.1 hypothetical protein GCM10010844_31440 [Deinococcus radiotolerans]